MFSPPISLQAVHKWTVVGKVPEERCPRIEQFTAGEWPVEALNPEVQWVRVKDRTWPHRGGRPLVDHCKAAA